MFTSTYERRLIEAQERLDKAKSEVAFFKLQIKQAASNHALRKRCRFDLPVNRCSGA